MNNDRKLIKLPAGWKPVRNQELTSEWKPDWPYIRFCLIGTIFFYLASSIFVYSASYFADFDTCKSPFHL